MQSFGALTADQAAAARAEQLTVAKTPSPLLAPHFVEMVLAAHGATRPSRAGDDARRAAAGDVAGIIRSHRAVLDRHGAANVAVVVLDNARGEWLAWEGSGDYGDVERGGAIDGAISPRQPGRR